MEQEVEVLHGTTSLICLYEEPQMADVMSIEWSISKFIGGNLLLRPLGRDSHMPHQGPSGSYRKW